MAILDPLPDKAPVTIDRDGSYIGSDWFRWLFALRSIVNTVPQKIGTSSSGTPPVSLTNQNAAIASTSIPLPALANGFYRVTAYARVTTADGVSSSVAVKIAWVESGVTVTPVTLFTLTADTVNTANGASVTALVDQNSVISYSTTYASNTANKMKYRLSILVEQL